MMAYVNEKDEELFSPLESRREVRGSRPEVWRDEVKRVAYPGRARRPSTRGIRKLRRRRVRNQNERKSTRGEKSTDMCR